MNRVKTKGVSRGFMAALALLSVMSVNCAVMPPGSGTVTTALSGTRLHVLMQYAGQMNQGGYYFFLINNSGSETAPGPVGILPGNIPSGVGNGFAASSDGRLFGFTDYVEYGPGNIYPTLYRVNSAGINVQATQVGQPVNIIQLPSSGGYVLEFEIDLAQLMYDASGQKVTDPATIKTMLAKMSYMQINIVSTNIVSVDQTTSVNRLVDALGNTLDNSQNKDFLLINVAQTQTTYAQGGFSGYGPTNVQEPGNNDDVYPGLDNTADASLNLINWSVAPNVVSTP